MAGSIIPLRFNSRFRLSWSSWDSPLPAVLNRPPRVAIPGFDASPPTLVWQTYNMQTKERGEIAKDGQSLEVPSGEQYVVTPAVEDLNSGVKDVILSGDVHFTCAQGGQVENKKFPLETQETKPVPDQENKVPIRASLVYVVEFGKAGCKENWLFGGGELFWWGRRIISLAAL